MRLLDALEAQTLERDRFEVVVVDDASTDETPARLAERAGDGRVHALRQETNRGPAAARNRGWRAARGAVVAFTDDDCRPEPGWLAAGAAAVESRGGLVMGRTTEPPDAPPPGPFTRSVVLESESPGYPTCNVFYERRALEAVGGFEESFRLPFGEDMDLAWRAKKAGWPSSYCAEAVVRHDVEPSDFRRFLRDRRRFAEHVHVLARHPDLRRFYTLGLFVRRSHVAVLGTLLLALLGVAASPWWLAAAPLLWIERCRSLRSSRRVGPAELAGWLAADFYEFAAFAAASVRYRTLLL